MRPAFRTILAAFFVGIAAALLTYLIIGAKL